MYQLPPIVFIHSAEERGRYGEPVFQAERKDLEGQTSRFGCFLEYLVPDKKIAAQGVRALQIEEILKQRDGKIFFRKEEVNLPKNSFSWVP